MRCAALFATAVVTAAAAWLLGAAPAAAGGWQRPVDGQVLRVFSVVSDRFAAGQHRGVDLAAPAGARLRAACAGRVSFAGRVPRGGRTVSVRCGRLVATYQHLGAVEVRRGQIVAAGARIGTVGSARPRPHVHLSARVAATGAYRDPLALLGGKPRSVPPPLPAGRPSLRPGRSPPRRPAGAPASALAPAPLAAPARPLAPAPAAAPAPGRPLPFAPAPHPRAERLPWPVWLGLALFGLGLPLGGLVRLRTRRRRAASPLPQAAS